MATLMFLEVEMNVSKPFCLGTGAETATSFPFESYAFIVPWSSLKDLATVSSEPIVPEFCGSYVAH